MLKRVLACRQVSGESRTTYNTRMESSRAAGTENFVPPPASDLPELCWEEDGVIRRARWRSENGASPPSRVLIADDRMNADAAYRFVSQGGALLWRGDFQNARQLLQALARRIDRNSQSLARFAPIPAEEFHHQRQLQAQRARLLGMLLLQFDEGHALPLRRAPDLRQACNEAYGVAPEPYVSSLREILGLIGAHEWRRKGLVVAALGARIYPHYGVFAPVRSEYLDLLAQTPLPATDLAFDVGTGTGVLAAILAQRGVRRVVATDQSLRALACAQDTILRLGLADRISLVRADLFPPGRAALIVCNPPWLPAQPSSLLEQAVYDPDSQMLCGFLAGLAEHLKYPKSGEPRSEGWLILSDIAEHLGLRSRDELLGWIASAGLEVIGRTDIRPRHPRASDDNDPLHKARAAEITSLWRLGVAANPSAG